MVMEHEDIRWVLVLGDNTERQSPKSLTFQALDLDLTLDLDSGLSLDNR